MMDYISIEWETHNPDASIVHALVDAGVDIEHLTVDPSHEYSIPVDDNDPDGEQIAFGSEIYDEDNPNFDERDPLFEVGAEVWMASYSPGGYMFLDGTTDLAELAREIAEHRVTHDDDSDDDGDGE